MHMWKFTGAICYGTKAHVRCLATKVKFAKPTFRKATLSDRHAVLALRHNVYRGLDYLADYYTYFLQDKNRHCFVGELNLEIVCFGVLLNIDNGNTLLSQAGRVHHKYEGMGIFGSLNDYFNAKAKEMGCKRRVALVETSSNKHARSKKFRMTHVEVCTKLHYAGLITDSVKKNIKEIVTLGKDYMNVNSISCTDLRRLILDVETRTNIFPNNIMLVDTIPYRCIEANIDLLKGKNTCFFSSIRTNSDSVTGLLSAGTNYTCTNPPASYTIDIFGTQVADLETHLRYHLSRAMEIIDSEFCLQIYVDKGYIAQMLCKALIRIDIPKYDNYMKGGIGTMTVVEKILL